MSRSSKIVFGHSGYFYIFRLCCLAMTMALLTGCASKDTVKFQEMVHKMSDAELQTYYRGINEKTKDIEYSMSSQEHLYQYDQEHWVYSSPFSPGGEGYRLMEQRRMVEAEMSKRNLMP